MSTNGNKNKGGRPAGRKKTAKIETVIEPEIKEQFMFLLQQEHKQASVQICEWIKNYIRERSINNEIL